MGVNSGIDLGSWTKLSKGKQSKQSSKPDTTCTSFMPLSSVIFNWRTSFHSNLWSAQCCVLLSAQPAPEMTPFRCQRQQWSQISSISERCCREIGVFKDALEAVKNFRAFYNNHNVSKCQTAKSLPSAVTSFSGDTHYGRCTSLQVNVSQLGLKEKQLKLTLKIREHKCKFSKSCQKPVTPRIKSSQRMKAFQTHCHSGQ